MADEQPGSGAVVADSPPAPDFSTFAREADARDVARVQPRSVSHPTSAASDPPQPVEQAAPSPGATDDAVTAPARPDSSKKPHNLDSRLSDVDAKIADLKQKLAIKRELEQQLGTRRTSEAPAADSPPAKPTQAEWQRYRHHPDAPKVEDFEAYEDFVAASSVFIADRRFEERAQRDRLDAESRRRVGETQQTISAFQGRLEEARTADAGFDAKVDDGLMQIVPAFALRPGEPPRPANVLVQEIVMSEAAPALLVHFSTPEGQQEWTQIASQPTPAALLKAFGRVEARFLSNGKAAPPAKATAKPVTSAPDPPTVLGTRPPANADRVGAAVQAGDFSAYKAAADAADLARFR